MSLHHKPSPPKIPAIVHAFGGSVGSALALLLLYPLERGTCAGVVLADCWPLVDGILLSSTGRCFRRACRSLFVFLLIN